MRNQTRTGSSTLRNASECGCYNGQVRAECRYTGTTNNQGDADDILLPRYEPMVENATAGPVDPDPDGPLIPPTLNSGEEARERDREHYRRLVGDATDDPDILPLPPPASSW